MSPSSRIDIRDDAVTTLSRDKSTCTTVSSGTIPITDVPIRSWIFSINLLMSLTDGAFWMVRCVWIDCACAYFFLMCGCESVPGMNVAFEFCIGARHSPDMYCHGPKRRHVPTRCIQLKHSIERGSRYRLDTIYDSLM